MSTAITATTIIGITGHRKMDHDYEKVKKLVTEKLVQYNANCIVLGMALGFDMLVAEACMNLGMPFVAAIPCQGQTSAWSKIEKERYSKILDKAWKTKIITSGTFAIWKLFERNKWIISRSNMILCYWDGKEKGGTFSTIKAAKAKNMPTENIYCQLK